MQNYCGKLKKGYSKGRGIYLAGAGTHLHQEALEQIRQRCINEGAVELLTKVDFVRFRAQGFSICKAIRDAHGRTVKILDGDKKKHMISIPDFVDYRKDIIMDLKTLHFRSAPERGGLFITEHSNPVIPKGYEEATGEFKKCIVRRTAKKYKAQFERYKKAYLRGTGRVATLHICIVPYAKVSS